MNFKTRLPIILADYLHRHLENGEEIAGKRFLEAGKLYRIVCIGGPYPEYTIQSLSVVDENDNTVATLQLVEYLPE